MSIPRKKTARRFSSRGFTMLELLVSTVVLITIITLLARALTQTESVWDRGQSRMRLLASGRAALNVIREDLESAFATNVYMLVKGSEGEFADHNVPSVTPSDSGYEIDESYGFKNAGLFFYRFSAIPRKGCYPVEAICYTVTNNPSARDSLGRDYDLPVLVRHDCRFKIVSDESHGNGAESDAWEEDSAPDIPDEIDEIGDLPSETGLPAAESLLTTTAQLLDGVAAFYCIPRSLTADGDHEATAIDYVDVYMELLTPSHCRRASSLSDDRQKEFVNKNALRLSARFAIGAHPAFNFPDSIATPWEARP